VTALLNVKLRPPPTPSQHMPQGSVGGARCGSRACRGHVERDILWPDGELVGFAGAGAAQGPDAEKGYPPARPLQLFSIYLLAAQHGKGVVPARWTSRGEPAQLSVARGNQGKKQRHVLVRCADRSPALSGRPKATRQKLAREIEADARRLRTRSAWDYIKDVRGSIGSFNITLGVTGVSATLGTTEGRADSGIWTSTSTSSSKT
jgi:hypothetical protein